MVQQRYSGLKRMGHAHPINLREDIEWKITLEVEVLQRRQPVAVLVTQTLGFQAGRITGHQFKDLGPEQALLILKFEKSRSVEVAIYAVQCKMLEKVFATSGIREAPGRSVPARCEGATG